MRIRTPALSVTLLAMLVAGCSTQEARRFAVEVDDGFYLINEQPIIHEAQSPQPEGIYVDTIDARLVDCPQMPCDDETRRAQEQAYWDFRKAPEGVTY